MEKIIINCKEVCKIKIVSINDDIYPQKLRTIQNPPKTLYLNGNLELLSKNTIAIIGSRNCSRNGAILASKFSYELSSLGICIVSGLAIGIDTFAHIGSYGQIGRTIAVLGSGFNNIFPEENIKLYKTILENDGLIVSEYPPQIKKQSKNFVERNRIISGLSFGIVVIEASKRSGTSITARHARSQRRKVFALPHEIWNKHGSRNKYINQKWGNSSHFCSRYF